MSCVLCAQCYQCLSRLSILDCRSVFSNVYLLPTACPVSCVPNVTSVSLDCPFLIAVRFSLTFIYCLRYVLCLVYPMLPVSLDCPFLIAPSVFSNVYLLLTVCPVSCVPNVTSVSLDCPFLIADRFYLTFIYYLRYVLCLVYPMLPVSL
jgi:hypothetical protein